MSGRVGEWGSEKDSLTENSSKLYFLGDYDRARKCEVSVSCVAVWLCGCVAVWLCDCVTV